MTLFVTHLLPSYRISNFPAITINRPNKLLQELLLVRLGLALERDPHNIGVHLFVERARVHRQLYQKEWQAVRVFLYGQVNSAFAVAEDCARCRIVFRWKLLGE